MGSAEGYEYEYRFRIDDDITHRYSCFKLRDDIKFLFEMRTNFRLKGGDCNCGSGDVIIDTERFEMGAEDSNPNLLNSLFQTRLKDYWFTDEEAWAFASQASAFAAAAAAELRGVIPIAVELDIRTVRRLGETLADAKDRAIRSEKLFPLYLMYNRNAFADVGKSPYHDLICFLRIMCSVRRVVRCEEEEGFRCAVCRLGGLKIGDQIAVMKNVCKDAFHYHCLVSYLLLKNTESRCPRCNLLLSSAIKPLNPNSLAYRFLFI